MNKKDLLDCVGHIDPALIEEADRCEPARRKKNLMKLGAFAACLCLVLAGAAIAGGLSVRQEHVDAPQPQAAEDGSEEKYAVYTDGIVLPEDAGNAKYDMIGCLVYKGSVYTQTSARIVDSSTAEQFLGEYLGEAKGTLDEWSSQEDWATEFASTYSGAVYTMKGYDEDFRLICKESWDADWFYILENLDSIGLNTGYDLFEKRLHIKGNIADVTYLTHDDWNFNGYFEHDYRHLESVSDGQLEEFFDTLCSSPFVRIDYDADENIYNTEIQGHLFLRMNDGTELELRLIDGGYVGYQGLGWIFVKMPGDIFDAVLNACQ